jgi:photosystem II stability/assembly factor-like uncharacterized protein
MTYFEKTMRAIILIALFVCSMQNFASAQAILYQDDFEGGTAAWWNAVPNCKVVSDGANNILQATGYVNAIFGEKEWDNYRFSCLIKVAKGDVQLQFRAGNNGFYSLWIAEHNISLARLNIPSNIQTPLADANLEIDFNKWHLFKIDLSGANIKIYRDNILYINTTDATPLLAGQLHFIVFNAGLAFFDNLLVETDKVVPKQPADWVATGGPVDGMGYDVRIHPINHDIMFVTDVWSGIHKSYDGGKTWYTKNNGIDTRLTPTRENRFGPSGDAIPIFCATIDPKNPDIVWCGTQNYKGIFKSVDCGESWTAKSNGIPDSLNLTFRSFAVDPTNSNVVYTGCEVSTGVDEVTGKIYKTTDGGENWFEALDSKSLVRIILIDPRNPRVIYSSTGIMDRGSVQEEGIWKSEDGGATWFHANNGLSPDALTVEGLDFVKSNPDILFASTGRWGPGFNRGPNTMRGGIYRSDDGGKNWVRNDVRPPGVQFVPMYLAISPSDPDVVYVGVSQDELVPGGSTILRTLDGGKTWRQFYLATEGIRAGVPIIVTVHPEKPNIVYVNYYGGGVVKSTDYGETWQNSSKGYTGAQVYDIAIDAANPATVYSTNRTDPYKSYDGGDNWIGLAYGSVKDANEWGAIELNPGNPRELLLGRGMTYIIDKSTDGGMNWHSVLNLPWSTVNDYGIVTSISWSKSDPRIVFATFHFRGNNVVPTDSVGCGIYKSEDGGETWKAVNNGLENTKKNGLTVEVHPRYSNVVLASLTDVGILKSTDGGSTWNKKNDGISNFHIKSFAFDPNNSQTVYAGIESGGIFKSTDLGEHWLQITYGMDPEASVRSIVVNPQNSLEVFAHDWSSGVYWSIDGGGSWYKMNNGLSTRAGQSLAISNDGSTLYAGTEGGGVFRLVRNQVPPSIQSLIPDTSHSIQIAKGDSLLFTVNASDLNNDIIHYSWYLNYSLIPNRDLPQFLLKTDKLEFGEYQLKAVVADSFSSSQATWHVTITSLSSVETDGKGIPKEYQLSQNYPNPFNPTTFIRYAIPKSTAVTLRIFNTLGQEVASLVNEQKSPGYYQIEWKANVPSGIYFFRLQAGEFVETKKMILLK